MNPRTHEEDIAVLNAERDRAHEQRIKDATKSLRIGTLGTILAATLAGAPTTAHDQLSKTTEEATNTLDDPHFNEQQARESRVKALALTIIKHGLNIEDVRKFADLDMNAYFQAPDTVVADMGLADKLTLAHMSTILYGLKKYANSDSTLLDLLAAAQNNHTTQSPSDILGVRG